MVIVVAVVVVVVLVEVVDDTVVDVVVVVEVPVVVVLVHTSPHIAGHCFSANSWWLPPAKQSPVGIRVPQASGSEIPWQSFGL